MCRSIFSDIQLLHITKDPLNIFASAAEFHNKCNGAVDIEKPGGWRVYPWGLTLDEVLNNTAPPPYTLSAFIEYLSQNHCLETLEFILEAKRYREGYKSLVESAEKSIETINSSASSNLSKLYQLLLATYILPGAAREVNLSVNVRDALLRQKYVDIAAA
ncbi:hypothetical protein N7499_004309 [Penicillium canescens]|nr:hypothetical protein N7499_004309 [Penicillium canescens]